MCLVARKNAVKSLQTVQAKVNRCVILYSLPKPIPEESMTACSRVEDSAL